MYSVYLVFDDGTIVDFYSCNLRLYARDYFFNWYNRFVFSDPNRGMDNSSAKYKVIMYRGHDLVNYSCPPEFLPKLF